MCGRSMKLRVSNTFDITVLQRPRHHTLLPTSYNDTINIQEWSQLAIKPGSNELVWSDYCYLKCFYTTIGLILINVCKANTVLPMFILLAVITAMLCILPNMQLNLLSFASGLFYLLLLLLPLSGSSGIHYLNPRTEYENIPMKDGV